MMAMTNNPSPTEPRECPNCGGDPTAAWHACPPRPTVDDELPPFIEQLRDHQQQLDADGVMVGVSRQALDEAMAERGDLQARLERYRVALQIFVNAAYPVANEINPRGHNWSEAYLDSALENAKALSDSTEGE